MTDDLIETLAEYPPMQVLRAIQDMAEDDDYRLTPEGIVTAATNVADVETIAKNANQKEAGPYLTVVKGDGFPNGIYLLADTPRQAIPLATEAGDGDRNLLHEALAEHDVLTVARMQYEANEYAHEKEFWRDIPEDRDDLWVPWALALIHSEVSEALKAHRRGDMGDFGEELADISTRTGDLAEEVGVDLELEIGVKQAKNEDRPPKHGKRY